MNKDARKGGCSHFLMYLSFGNYRFGLMAFVALFIMLLIQFILLSNHTSNVHVQVINDMPLLTKDPTKKEREPNAIAKTTVAVGELSDYRSSLWPSSSHFCSICPFTHGVTCKQRVEHYVQQSYFTQEEAVTKVMNEREACIFSELSMDLKIEDVCFITANIGKSLHNVDRIPSVLDFASRFGSKFFLFTNLQGIDAEGWETIVFFDLEMQRYNRWITHSRWPKFVGWKHPTIVSAGCRVITYCDAYICNPKNPGEWLSAGKAVLSNDRGSNQGGWMQLRQIGTAFAGPEAEIEKAVRSGKLDGDLGNKTIEWLRSQPDYNKRSMVYKCAVIIYDPNNKKFQHLTERFWATYSKEELGWRDQPFWSYFVSSEKIQPMIIESLSSLFVPVEMEGRGFGGHTYAISDVVINDTKLVQTAMSFDIPWKLWMQRNVMNQKDGQELMTTLADKVLVKEWLTKQNVSNKMKVPTTYWTTTNVSSISLKDLPSSYVLKSNHASGTVIPVKDGINLITKKSIDVKNFKKQATNWMENIVWGTWGELWYTKIKPQVFAEEFIESNSENVPYDFKLHVIHQKVVIIQVCISRYTNEVHHFYNHNFERINISWHPKKYDDILNPSIPKPVVFDDMISISETISAPFPYVRVDLYEKDNTLYFSELTFAHYAAKLGPYPQYIDNVLGYMLAHKEAIPMLQKFSFIK